MTAPANPPDRAPKVRNLLADLAVPASGERFEELLACRGGRRQIGSRRPCHDRMASPETAARYNAPSSTRSGTAVTPFLPRASSLRRQHARLLAFLLLCVGILAGSPNRAEVAPPASAPAASARLQAAQRACDGPCVTPFGLPLGRAAGVEARSNCVSGCLRLEASFVDPASGRLQAQRMPAEPPAGLEYAGVTYQCVEYARRWWIRALGLTFGDVPTAADLLALTEGKRLADQAAIPLGRALNGEARRAPRRGDLVIYAADPDDPDWRFGHVAVVVATDLAQGWVALAEQNYDNRPWEAPESHARRIQIVRIGGRHTLLDLAPGQRDHPEGGRIAGWLYPALEPDTVTVDREPQ